MISSDKDASLKWCSTPPLWHSMPSGGVHPIISVRFEGAKPALTGKADMLLRPLVYRLMTQRVSGSKANFDAMVVHRTYSFMETTYFNRLSLIAPRTYPSDCRCRG